MKVNRNMFEIDKIYKQFKRETNEPFDLNRIIDWLGNRKVVEIDDDLLTDSSS